MTHQNCPLKRLDNESPQAFDAFVVYAEMGWKDRSIDKAYLKASNQEQTSKTVTHHWHKWSREFNWQDRVREYDDWLFNEGIQEKIRLRRFIIEDLGDRIKNNLENDLKLSSELSKHLEKFLEKGDINPMIFKSFCQAHKDIVSTRKDIFESYMYLTGINQLSDFLAKEKDKS